MSVVQTQLDPLTLVLPFLLHPKGSLLYHTGIVLGNVQLRNRCRWLKYDCLHFFFPCIVMGQRSPSPSICILLGIQIESDC